MKTFYDFEIIVNGGILNNNNMVHINANLYWEVLNGGWPLLKVRLYSRSGLISIRYWIYYIVPERCLWKVRLIVNNNYFEIYINFRNVNYKFSDNPDLQLIIKLYFNHPITKSVFLKNNPPRFCWNSTVMIGNSPQRQK